ncbi:hypothetical protein [Staphylococcus pseudoxylosus]|uniref:hypothetical protein n=1 Tax=Staphylococcus pseudoxylosus TaxID=2282419 RepID=UPI0039068686
MTFINKLKNNQLFMSNLSIFIVAHFVINILIHTDKTPVFLNGIKNIILDGKIWFYHDETGIFVFIIWLAFIIYQGFSVFTSDNNKNKEES